MSEPRDTRFRKGRSGNPKGRPPKSSTQDPFHNVIYAQKQTVVHNGVEREVSAEEALQIKTLQQAFSGNKQAATEVFKWIEKRAIQRAKDRSPQITEPEFVLIRERDSDHAFDAMCLLGIATHRPGHERFRSAAWNEGKVLDGNRIKLQAWAVSAAFERNPALHDDQALNTCLRMNGHVHQNLDQQ